VTYYNDNDPRVCAWTEELIKAGLIADGKVDCRSIVEVTADDLKGFTQCHFFNGISGWAHALDLAGWSRERPVWCASLPCQPFSCAGARKGEKDERHLWPEFYRLIRECRPAVVFGEQVEGAVKLGWIDRVQADLEAEGYACGYHVLGSHSVGAPHRRQRLYWVADAVLNGHESQGQPRQELDSARRGVPSRMAHPNGRIPCDGEIQRSGEHAERDQDGGAGGGMGDTPDFRLQGAGRGQTGEQDRESTPRRRPAHKGRLVNPNSQRCNRQPIHLCRGKSRQAMPEVAGAGGAGFWDNSIWLPCSDGKARRCPESVFQRVVTRLPGGLDLDGAESGFPLCEKIQGRVMLLRGFGNAINPYQAAEFVKAYLEVIPHG
jgi:DNA (cytosine-5)-methyltransferase 1